MISKSTWKYVLKWATISSWLHDCACSVMYWKSVHIRLSVLWDTVREANVQSGCEWWALWAGGAYLQTMQQCGAPPQYKLWAFTLLLQTTKWSCAPDTRCSHDTLCVYIQGCWLACTHCDGRGQSLSGNQWQSGHTRSVIYIYNRRQPSWEIRFWLYIKRKRVQLDLVGSDRHTSI